MRFSAEITYSDHNLILFNIRILSNNTKYNRVVSNSERKFATQLGTWNRISLQVQQNNQQWTYLENRARTKEQLEKYAKKLAKYARGVPPFFFN
jgi:hypothetical protein